MTGILEASQNVFVRNPRVIFKDLRFTPTLPKQINDELNSQTRATNDWFSS